MLGNQVVGCRVFWMEERDGHERRSSGALELFCPPVAVAILEMYTCVNI